MFSDNGNIWESMRGMYPAIITKFGKHFNETDTYEFKVHISGVTDTDLTEYLDNCKNHKMFHTRLVDFITEGNPENCILYTSNIITGKETVTLEFICVRDTRIRHMLNKYKEITENGIPLENVTIHCSADISVRENVSIPNISVYTNGFAT